MTPDDLDNFDSDSDPAIEALGFGGLETDDLLRFVEGEMAPERVRGVSRVGAGR